MIKISGHLPITPTCAKFPKSPWQGGFKGLVVHWKCPNNSKIYYCFSANGICTLIDNLLSNLCLTSDSINCYNTDNNRQLTVQRSFAPCYHLPVRSGKHSFAQSIRRFRKTLQLDETLRPFPKKHNPPNTPKNGKGKHMNHKQKIGYTIATFGC